VSNVTCDWMDEQINQTKLTSWSWAGWMILLSVQQWKLLINNSNPFTFTKAPIHSCYMPQSSESYSQRKFINALSSSLYHLWKTLWHYAVIKLCRLLRPINAHSVIHGWGLVLTKPTSIINTHCESLKIYITMATGWQGVYKLVSRNHPFSNLLTDALTSNKCKISFASAPVNSAKMYQYQCSAQCCSLQFPVNFWFTVLWCRRLLTPFIIQKEYLH